MSLTSDFASTANDNGANLPGGRRLGREVSVLPRSPAEALEPMRPPGPPEREPRDSNDHPFLRMLSGLLSFVFILGCLLVGVLYFVKIQFDRPGPLETSTVVVVPKGEGTGGIAEQLERDGVITDRRIFMTSALYFIYLKGNSSLKAGEYEFRKHASMRQVLDTLVQGKSIDHKITIPEGLTTQQIVERLQSDSDLNGDIAAVPAEGTLLPDTYRFEAGDTREDIIERMQVEQQKFLEKVWEERDPDVMVKSPQEAVILASIVEKETGRADERPHIACVFENRLKKNMRLQSDPTIIYGLVGGKGVLDHPIQQDELDRDTPYNTYKINGLPPTPIANPGRAAIEAVLKPSKTKDLYFVADGKGGHVFAATLEDHNKNVVRWRQTEKQIREREAEAQAAAAAAGNPVGPAAPATPGGTGTLAAPEALAGNPGVPATATPPATEAPAGPSVPLPLRNPRR